MVRGIEAYCYDWARAGNGQAVAICDADNASMTRTSGSLLELRLGIPDLAVPDAYPVVQMLVDGRELLAGVGPRGFIGSPPTAILAEDLPLLPADSPRRVVLYVCTCGVPACGQPGTSHQHSRRVCHLDRLPPGGGHG
jgi:hypothetical protein